VLAGDANRGLAEAVAQHAGLRMGAAAIERFPDGEVSVQLGTSVRRKEVFVVQPTSPPVNDHLIELLALIDACRRAAAARITAIVPYFGYARQDRRPGRREPITARLVATLLEVAGVDHLVTLDLHTPQIEGFFRVPVDNLTAVPILSDAVPAWLRDDVVVVAPDAGRVKMAEEYARRLRAPVAVLHKRRESGSQTSVTHLVGDVRDRPCLIVDDMISTGGTIAGSVQALLGAGALPEILVAATHGLLLDGAREQLDQASVREVMVTDSVAQARRSWPKLRVVSVAPLLGGALRRFIANHSLGDLF
jgi:ribose-phosphate pyrophosphokinase